MKIRLLTIIFGIVISISASVPREIVYQGLLTDQNKTPLADGDYQITFSLYDAESATTALWTEDQTLKTKQGVFSASIGTKTGGINIAFDKQYWLGVKAGNKELLPRVKIGSSAYALRSAVADSVIRVDGALIKAVSIDSSKIKAGGISGGTIAVNAIDSSKIKNGSVSTSDVAASFKAPLAGIADSAKNASYAASAGSVSAESHAHFYLTKKGKVTEPVVIVDTVGNVGIGRLDPGAKLSILANDAGNGIFVDNSYSAGYSVIRLNGHNGHNAFGAALHSFGPKYKDDNAAFSASTTSLLASDSGGLTFAATTGNIRFYTAGAMLANERMRITAGGNVGIGNKNPQFALDVTGDIHATNFPSSSDLRFKTNIDSIPNALQKIGSLQGVTYNWNKEKFPERNFPEGKQIGLIAQDVEKVLPELVHTDSDGYKSLSYDKLTAVLVEAVKKQQELINEQKSQIEALKVQNENLQLKNDNIEKRLQALESGK